MAPKYGSHWYLDKSFFSGAFEYDKFIENVAERCKDPDELFIEYYNKIYDVPPLPPSWMIMEIITFSKISLIFEHLAARQEKLQVCSNFGLPENILLSWFRCFNFIRNKCAHHNRIVYTAIKFQPVMPSRRKHKFLAESELISPNLIYCSLCCMQFLIRSINPKSKFSENILKLIKDNPQINLPSIGFTPKWHEEDIWN
jgi:abortive infection bacteriophage resistance protein